MEVMVNSSSTLAFPVTEGSQVGEVRRAAGALAKSLGFDEQRAGQVMVVATELAKNLAVHAKEGEAFVSRVTSGGVEGVELLAVDRGPGMADVSRHSRDGFSTAGTAGMGLGAIARMSDRFAIHSARGAGTVSVARIWRVAPKAAARRWMSAVVASPMRGENVSGDASAAAEFGFRAVAMVADGLGHGPQAAEAALAATAVFEADPSLPPGEMIGRMHEALRRTRGAAVAVVAVDWRRREVRFCGIGNIAANLICADETRTLMSHNGIVGHAVSRVQELEYPAPEGGVLVMNSDGLKSRWSLDRYAGVLAQDAAVIAGIVYRDNRRDRDDATVLVLREQPQGRAEP